MIEANLIDGTVLTIKQGPMLRDQKRLVQISQEGGKSFQILFDKSLPGYNESFAQYLNECQYTMEFTVAFKHEPEMNKEEWIEQLIIKYPHRFCKFCNNVSKNRYTIVELTLQIIPVNNVLGFICSFMRDMATSERFDTDTVLQRRRLQKVIEKQVMIRDDRKSYEEPAKALIENYLFD